MLWFRIEENIPIQHYEIKNFKLTLKLVTRDSKNQFQQWIDNKKSIQAFSKCAKFWMQKEDCDESNQLRPPKHAYQHVFASRSTSKFVSHAIKKKAIITYSFNLLKKQSNNKCKRRLRGFYWVGKGCMMNTIDDHDVMVMMVHDIIPQLPS